MTFFPRHLSSKSPVSLVGLSEWPISHISPSLKKEHVAILPNETWGGDWNGGVETLFTD